MKVLCARTELVDAERASIGLPPNAGYPLQEGTQYVVFALHHIGGRIWYTLAATDDYLFDAPASLFHVVEANVSALWKVVVGSDSLSLGPPEMAEVGFLERLVEGDPRAVEIFQYLRSQLESE